MRFQHRVERSELYFCALNQRRDCLVKTDMVKVNKLQLGYCVADRIGNDFVTEAERCVCLHTLFWFVCMCECVLRRCPVSCFFSVEVFSWQRVFQLTCQCYSAYRAVKWPTMGLTWGPRSLFQLFPSHRCFPNCVLFLFFHLHSTLVPPALYSLALLFLSYVGRIACFLSFSPET